MLLVCPGADVGSGRRKKTMSRPFGVALLVAGVDQDGPALYCADPSGAVAFPELQNHQVFCCMGKSPQTVAESVDLSKPDPPLQRK